MKPLDLNALCIRMDNTIRDAAECIDRNTRGIALVVDDEMRLLATTTDGDIRRSMLAGANLRSSVASLVAAKPSSKYPKPVTVLKGTPPGKVLSIMQEQTLRQMPVLDNKGRLVDLVTLDELIPDRILPLQAVVMAGGEGNRLRPLTEDVPKPMLPVGDKPLMEIIIEQLRQAGISNVNVTTHYLPEQIKEHFGNGEDFGVELNYVSEDRPLGTAGALALMEKSEEPLLVVNGDILTNVDYQTMLAFHRKNKADLTVAVRQYDLQVPYGIVECDGPRIARVQEKPSLNFLVNAGIYLLEPHALQYIPEDRKFDMTDLIERLIAEDRMVVSFPVIEYWLDIGKPDDYRQAQTDLEDGRLHP
ncbi:nucleotidyltransferase family protein [Candidatus Hydrogenedentota bacterium]